MTIIAFPIPRQQRKSLGVKVIARKATQMLPGCSRPLHMAIIQQPTRKWEKPWRRQRAIVLFAESSEEMRLRLQLERRLRTGERILEVLRMGGAQ
jgi:hypothetical protein